VSYEIVRPPLSSLSFSVEGDKLRFDFECPRCGEKTTTLLPPKAILSGFAVRCNNVSCWPLHATGRPGYTIEFDVHWTAYELPVEDRPLA